jgi:hypothetical protein
LANPQSADPEALRPYASQAEIELMQGYAEAGFQYNAMALGGGALRPAGAPRSFSSFRSLKHGLGSAGKGKVWHHIVEQRRANIERFGAKAIHSTENVVAVPCEVNQAIADYYSSIRQFTSGKTVRQWLDSQSFEEQSAFGTRILTAVLTGKLLPK